MAVFDATSEIAVVTMPGRIEVVVALQRGARTTRYRCVFGPGGLQAVFDDPDSRVQLQELNLAPAHPARQARTVPCVTIEVSPLGGDSYVHFTWTGITQVHFERDARGNVTAILVGAVRAVRE